MLRWADIKAFSYRLIKKITGENKMARKLRCPDSFGFDWRVEVPDYYARRVNSFLNRFDVNTKNRFGQTLLMLLVNKGIEELVQLVISKGANVNEADKRGVTPLMIAVGANDKSA